MKSIFFAKNSKSIHNLATNWVYTVSTGRNSGRAISHFHNNPPKQGNGNKAVALSPFLCKIETNLAKRGKVCCEKLIQ